jgi:hypothetical protein
MTRKSSVVPIDTEYGEGLDSELDVGSIRGWINGVVA